MAYPSVVFGLIAAVCWGTADYLSRRQSEKVGSFVAVLYSNLAALVVLLALFPVVMPNLAVTPKVALVLVASGLMYFAAFIFLYRALHRGVVSVVAPIAYAYPAFTVGFSIILLGVVLPSDRLLSIVGVMVGVVLLSTKFSELRAYFGGKGIPRLTAGVLPALASSFFFGIAYMGVGYAAPLVNFLLPAVFLRGVATGVGFLLAPVLKQKAGPSRSTLSNTIIVMGVLEAAGFVGFTYGVSSGGASLPIVAAVSAMGGAVAASYAMIFLKERLEWNQAVGVVVSLSGIFALLYFGG